VLTYFEWVGPPQPTLKPEYKNHVEYPPDGHQNRRWMSYRKNARGKICSATQTFIPYPPKRILMPVIRKSHFVFGQIVVFLK
jgi:hypothetical protein